MAGFTAPPQFASNPYMTGGVNPYLQYLINSGGMSAPSGGGGMPSAPQGGGPGGMGGLVSLGTKALGSLGGGGAAGAEAAGAAGLAELPGLPTAGMLGAEGVPAFSASAPGALTPAASSGTFSLGGIGGAGNAILPLAGAAGMYDLFANKREGGRGLLQGAASGAAMGSYFGPWGAGIGGLVGLGAGLLGSQFDKDMWKTEGDRWRKLADSGMNIGGFGREAMSLTGGRSKEDLINRNYALDFRGEIPGGGWVNNRFAQSRNEGDLTGKDIWGYATFAEKFGPNWINTSADNREAIANKALELGLVREHHGTVDVNWNDDLTSYAQKLLGQSTGQAPGSTTTATTPTTTGVPKPTFTKEDIERKVEEAKKFAEQQKKKVEDQYGFLFK